MIKKSFVLSGGGCRGFAHLGAVKALMEQNIYPNEIAGTSAGAIAGAFLADGFTPDEIREMFGAGMNFKILAWNGFKMGMISMKKIRDFLKKNLRHTEFESFSIPFYATATNFVNGSQEIFYKGNVIDAILASCAIPVLFPPVVINDIPYVDGGLSNNLPVEPFKDKKNEVICVHVNPIKLFDSNESVLEVMDRAWHLSFRNMVNRSSQGCYLNIEPTGLNVYGLFDFHKSFEIFEVGYTFTKELLQNRANISINFTIKD